MIHDVKIEPLKIINTEGGSVLHMLRSDSPLFKSFGEIYFSELQPKAIKAWKRHHEQTQNICVPSGAALFVLYDNRVNSPSCGKFMELKLGKTEAYSLLQIPPLIWYGFACLGSSMALLANCANIPHNPLESERIDLNSELIPYSWC